MMGTSRATESWSTHILRHTTSRSRDCHRRLSDTTSILRESDPIEKVDYDHTAESLHDNTSHKGNDEPWKEDCGQQHYDAIALLLHRRKGMDQLNVRYRQWVVNTYSWHWDIKSFLNMVHSSAWWRERATTELAKLPIDPKMATKAAIRAIYSDQKEQETSQKRWGW